MLTNLDTKTIYFALFFNTPDGNGLALPVSGMGSVSQVNGTLPVNQTVTFETDGSGDLAQGFVTFYSLDQPASEPAAQVALSNLGGMAIIRGSPADRPSFEATVPIVPAYETRYTLPFDSRNGIRSGLILLNSSTKASPLSIVIRDTSGGVLARDTVTLNSFQQISAVLSDVYPQTADQVGVLQVSTSAIGLSGLGLRLDARLWRLRGPMNAEEFAERRVDLAGWPVNITTYKLGSTCRRYAGADHRRHY